MLARPTPRIWWTFAPCQDLYRQVQFSTCNPSQHPCIKGATSTTTNITNSEPYNFACLFGICRLFPAVFSFASHNFRRKGKTERLSTTLLGSTNQSQPNCPVAPVNVIILIFTISQNPQAYCGSFADRCCVETEAGSLLAPN